MPKSYRAIFHDGVVEWIDAPPRMHRTPILVVVDEPAETEISAETVSNGAKLVDLIDQWEPELREKMLEKFGDPIEWQHEQRRERSLPSRENA
jgi:hypothetical protein